MTEGLRAVFDTNVFVSAALSTNPSSPTRELMAHWQNNAFGVVTCQQLAEELAEKLSERKASGAAIEALLAALFVLAEWVDVPPEAVVRVLPDPDDDVVLACAVLGQVDYVVTYDPHFDALGGEYRGITIAKALPFLWAVRGDAPPSA